MEQNFSTPENLSNSAGIADNPQIAVSGNNVYVIWEDKVESDSDIFISVSTDGGQNFMTPENISKVEGSAGIADNPQISTS